MLMLASIEHELNITTTVALSYKCSFIYIHLLDRMTERVSADHSILERPRPLITAPTDGSHRSLATASAVCAVYCGLLRWLEQQSEQPEQYLATPKTVCSIVL